MIYKAYILIVHSIKTEIERTDLLQTLSLLSSSSNKIKSFYAKTKTILFNMIAKSKVYHGFKINFLPILSLTISNGPISKID